MTDKIKEITQKLSTIKCRFCLLKWWFYLCWFESVTLPILHYAWGLLQTKSESKKNTLATLSKTKYQLTILHIIYTICYPLSNKCLVLEADL